MLDTMQWRCCQHRAVPLSAHALQLGCIYSSLDFLYGRYGFNIAPAYLRGTERSTIAARAAVNTTLCGCASALTVSAPTAPAGACRVHHSGWPLTL